MAFRDFDFPEVVPLLGLKLSEADLHGTVPPMNLSTEFSERLRVAVDLALAVNTEKARSEFIIAPILLELHRIMGGSFGLFSGIEFDVDSSRGLNGYCDFILTRSRLQTVMTAPIVAVVEAKNDNIHSGLGQCIAAMVAAREYNAGSSILTVHGVVTTGAAWRFLRLEGIDLILDQREYFVVEINRVMAILRCLVEGN